ncbi:MAG: C/D box methylation guide ribonucleoprotein complex aNOP56 subunit [Candidatus Verstraetearchaeota archaeon]|nr:C/D box methylation guide ribonucleoprotein complex aNOP56 subunit [Candidatus Methanomethylicia archaeon]NHV60128.1 C/D box methylation guide ribonucleoprotein complex aNOP56 subunit [Candidatus Verstraetearchaeota archaeon]
MKCYIVESFLGFLAYDEDLKVIAAKPFNDVEDAVSELIELERYGLSPSLESLLKDLTGMGCDSLVVEDEKEAKALKGKYNMQIQVISPSAAGRVFRASAVEAWQKSGLKLTKIVRMQKDVAEALAKAKVRAASERRDRLVAQAVTALDEVDKSINIIISRVREWYGLHFPELDSLVPDHRQYLTMVTKFGSRSEYSPNGLNEIVQNENKAMTIYDLTKKSMGAEIGELDLEKIKQLAEICLNLYSYRDHLERYIDETMKEVAPNIRELVGSSLGARLIALSGGLEALAKKPASTIQVLGAEKALFRSLKTGAKPPKHGIIFQSQYIHAAPKWQRGKIARALAGKLSIAARVDAFGGDFIGTTLKQVLEKRIEDIKAKYARPPKEKFKHKWNKRRRR